MKSRFQLLPLFASLMIGLLCPLNLHAADPLPIKLVVKIKEKPSEPAKPFPDVGGFSMRRNTSEFKGATCPNASNGKGELVCRVTCDMADADLRLLVLIPLKEKARIVAGLTPPSAIAIDIEGCKLTSKVPLEVVYKTAEVVLSELQAYAPNVFKAIVADAKKPFSLKPFAESSADLKVLAANERNRDAILQISRLAVAYQEAPPERRPPEEANLAQYAVGVNSVVLQAFVHDAIGLKGPELVKVSADSADFHHSVVLIEKELNNKPILTAREIQLSKDVRLIKRQDPKRAMDIVKFQGGSIGRP